MVEVVVVAVYLTFIGSGSGNIFNSCVPVVVVVVSGRILNNSALVVVVVVVVVE